MFGSGPKDWQHEEYEKGRGCLLGEGRRYSLREAARWLRASARGKRPLSWGALADLLWWAPRLEHKADEASFWKAKARSHPEYLEQLQEAVRHHEPLAQAMLALELLEGELGEEGGQERALELLEQAAARKHPDAMYRLGLLYLEGEAGLERAEEQAYGWLLQAGEREHPGAQVRLAQRNYDAADPKVGEALAWLHKAAEGGHAHGAHLLAVAHHAGLGVEPCMERAFHWYQKAAQAGHPGSQNALGVCYSEGLGVAKSDQAEAFGWFSKAAEQGEPEALRNLGTMHAKGRGVAQSYAQAFEHYQRAARLGCVSAYLELKLAYEQGNGVEIDLERSHHWLLRAVDADDSLALVVAGQKYLYGEQPVEVDQRRAIGYFRRAAALGDALGSMMLGLVFDEGLGVDADPDEAFFWYHQGAERGNPECQYRLAECYEEGIGVAPDDSLATHWYLQAARQGNPKAQCSLGFRYLNGAGVERDPGLAFEWWLKAAQQGESSSQLNLGLMYLRGIGPGLCEQSDERAFAWFARAAEADQPDALCCIAQMHEAGRGSQADPAQAHQWYERAARLGHHEAIAWLESRPERA